MQLYLNLYLGNSNKVGLINGLIGRGLPVAK